MNISLVPIGQVAGVMPSLFPFLAESVKWSRGRVVVDDILRFVLNGQMQLWAVGGVSAGVPMRGPSLTRPIPPPP
jgi:hypothetical protein